MNVGEMCSRVAVQAPESATLEEVASLMRERRVGCIVVTRSTKQPTVVGIITDRDIVRAQLEHVANLSRLRVADVMTKGPLTVQPDFSLEEAIHLMRAQGVRRAPVVDAHGVPVGMVSTDDLIVEMARQLESMAGLVRNSTSGTRSFL
jgi:CBS domain-containing protein